MTVYEHPCAVVPYPCQAIGIKVLGFIILVCNDCFSILVDIAPLAIFLSSGQSLMESSDLCPLGLYDEVAAGANKSV